MAPKRKRVWKRDESAKEARRARKDKENFKNAEANAKTRTLESVQAKFEKERAKIPHPPHMSKEVESSSLVKAMEKGFLNDLRMFRMKDHKFFVPILMNPSNLYVSYIRCGLQEYLDSIEGEALEESEVERVQTYFEDEDWKQYEYGRACHLINVLEANDFCYDNLLWENESLWKEDWKTKRMGKWKLLYPLRSNEMQDRLQQRALENTIVDEGGTTTLKEGGPSSCTPRNTRMTRAKAKPKPKPKPKAQNKGEGKGKGRGKR